METKSSCEKNIKRAAHRTNGKISATNEQVRNLKGGEAEKHYSGSLSPEYLGLVHTN